MTRRTEPPDLRLLPPVAGAWAASWFGLTEPPRLTVAAAAAAALIGVAGLRRARRVAAGHPASAEPSSTALCAALLVAAGFALSAAVHAAVGANGPVPGLAAGGAHVEARMTVTADPKRIDPPPGSNRGALALLPVRLTDLAVREGPGYRVGAQATVLAFLRGPRDERAWLDLLPSEQVELTGRLKPPRPGCRSAAA